jgi:hypothetical protein
LREQRRGHVPRDAQDGHRRGRAAAVRRRRGLEVTPQVPQGQSRVAGSNIRLAGGAVDVAASHADDTYTTRVMLGMPLPAFTIGHMLPRGTGVARVTLDGRQVAYSTVTSNRGVEVLAAAPTSGTHELVVTAR